MEEFLNTYGGIRSISSLEFTDGAFIRKGEVPEQGADIILKIFERECDLFEFKNCRRINLEGHDPTPQDEAPSGGAGAKDFQGGLPDFFFGPILK